MLQIAVRRPTIILTINSLMDFLFCDLVVPKARQAPTNSIDELFWPDRLLPHSPSRPYGWEPRPKMLFFGSLGTTLAQLIALCCLAVREQTIKKNDLFRETQL